MGFHSGSDGEEFACNVGDPGSIPGLGRSPGEGNGNPLQYSCPENPMDRGAWPATVHGVTRVGHDLATKPPPPRQEARMGLFHQPVDSQHLEQVTNKCSFTQPQILAQHLLTHQGTDSSTCRNGAAHRETEGHSRRQ